MIVTTYGNRPCLTDQVVVDFPLDLQLWVREACERPIDPNIEVWLLPVSESDEE